MRILSFNMQGSAVTQFVEDNEEAERLYAKAANALTNYETFVRERRPTYELVVSDGTRQTFCLSSLLSVTMAVPGVPDWLRDFHVAAKRMELRIVREARSDEPSGP